MGFKVLTPSQARQQYQIEIPFSIKAREGMVVDPIAVQQFVTLSAQLKKIIHKQLEFNQMMTQIAKRMIPLNEGVQRNQLIAVQKVLLSRQRVEQKKQIAAQTAIQQLEEQGYQQMTFIHLTSDQALKQYQIQIPFAIKVREGTVVDPKAVEQLVALKIKMQRILQTRSEIEKAINQNTMKMSSRGHRRTVHRIPLVHAQRVVLDRQKRILEAYNRTQKAIKRMNAKGYDS